jgi:hypothetical protein
MPGKNFERVCGIEELAHSKLFVFFNMKHRFREKIEQKDMRDTEKLWFMDYTGGPDHDSAMRYLRKRVQRIAGPKRKVYTRATFALDPQDMKITYGMLRSECISHSFGAYRKKKADAFASDSDDDEDGAGEATPLVP